MRTDKKTSRLDTDSMTSGWSADADALTEVRPALPEPQTRAGARR